MKRIKLGKKNIYALVDDEDFERISQISWYLDCCGYAKSMKYISQRPKRKYIITYLHRFIMNAPKGKKVDHINHDPLDNRKQNLRLCKHSENLQNQKKRKGKHASKYKGVVLMKTYNLKKPWMARITKEFKPYHLGYFATQEEAARAYDIKAKELFGEFALFNFK